ncbi:hypothetical protein DSUL_150011 [Desulfovibrionales bacterium]
MNDIIVFGPSLSNANLTGQTVCHAPTPACVYDALVMSQPS